MLTRVDRNQDLGEGWWMVAATAPDLAPRIRAGQFVQVRIGDGDDPLVRRPFSVYDLLPEPGAGAEQVVLLYQVVGPGTRWMARLHRGDALDLLGPLGKPFPELRPARGGEIVLVGGGIGVAPLFLYCRELRRAAEPPAHRVLLGARRAALLVGRAGFESLGVRTLAATEDGSEGFHGNVVSLLAREIESLERERFSGIGCGPHGMNMALRDFAVARSLEMWISLENYMPCGFGACFGCVIRIPGSNPARYRRVCVEGPAFRAQEICVH